MIFQPFKFSGSNNQHKIVGPDTLLSLAPQLVAMSARLWKLGQNISRCKEEKTMCSKKTSKFPISIHRRFDEGTRVNVFWISPEL